MFHQDSSVVMGIASLPTCAKVATGLQALVAILVLAVWVLWASWGIISWWHLALTGIVFFPAFALCVAALIGLSKGMMFGWVIALLGNGASAAALLFFSGPFAVLPAAVLAYLLIPSVRGYYVQGYYR